MLGQVLPLDLHLKTLVHGCLVLDGRGGRGRGGGHGVVTLLYVGVQVDDEIPNAQLPLVVVVIEAAAARGHRRPGQGPLVATARLAIHRRRRTAGPRGRVFHWVPLDRLRIPPRSWLS